MAGRVRAPGEELRTERMSVRWTSKEMDRIRQAKEVFDFRYESDVVRDLTLKRLDTEERLRRLGPQLERVRENLGLGTNEETLWFLALQQLERASSASEKDVAE